MSDKPLQGVTVVDCASLLAGPMAATLMGDFGADVIKVEHPTGDKTRGWGGNDLAWKWVSRNKKSVTVDLHEEAGQRVFKEIVEDADILIENFRPGTLEGWGLGWETLSSVNPDLVMVRTTGFGQTGPYKNRAGFGTLAEAMSGFAYATGEPDGPPTLPPLALADYISALYSTFAAAFSIYWRDVNGGSGQYIDTSILEPFFAVMGNHFIEYSVNGNIRERQGNRQQGNPGRNTYKTKDGRWVALSPGGSAIIERVLRIVGGEELVNDPRFRTTKRRIEHIDALEERIQAWMSEHTREEVIDIFTDANAAIAPIYNMEDLAHDPHLDARESIRAVDDPDHGTVEMPGVVPKLSETPGAIERSGPKLGEHTEAVLKDSTSLSDDRLAELREAGIITFGEDTERAS